MNRSRNHHQTHHVTRVMVPRASTVPLNVITRRIGIGSPERAAAAVAVDVAALTAEEDEVATADEYAPLFELRLLDVRVLEFDRGATAAGEATDGAGAAGAAEDLSRVGFQ